MIYCINLNRKNILGYDRTLRYFLIYDRNSKYSKVIIDKFNLIVYHTALMSPGLLNSIWQAVKSLLVKIGRAQTAIVMAAIYFVIIGPMAILFQIFHRQKHSRQSYWIKKEPITDMNLYLTRQF